VDITAFFANFGSAFITFLSTLIAVVIALFILDNEDEYEALNTKIDKLTEDTDTLLSLQVDIAKKLSELQDQIGVVTKDS
jgi:hypothetical protein